MLKAASPRHKRPELLPALTGLRFLLALWVIVNHLTGPGGMLDAQARALPYFFYSFLRGGYEAVTTFFVLSGFVLMRSYASTIWTRGNLLRYGVGRIARVYPVYALSLLAVAPFIAEDRTSGKGRVLAEHIALVQGWLGPLTVNWNTPAWSLSCEMFFYLVFPLAAMAMRRAAWRGAFAVAAVACCLTRVMWWLGVPDGVKPLVHLADFLMGIAAAHAFALLPKWRRPSTGAWLYLPAGALGALAIAYPTALPGFLDLNSALRPLNALLLIGLALGGGVVARTLSTQPAVYLGKASYAMYILHVPALWWYGRWSRTQSAPVYLAAVIAISALVYGLIEEPANRYLRARFRFERTL